MELIFSYSACVSGSSELIMCANVVLAIFTRHLKSLTATTYCNILKCVLSLPWVTSVHFFLLGLWIAYEIRRVSTICECLGYRNTRRKDNQGLFLRLDSVKLAGVWYYSTQISWDPLFAIGLLQPPPTLFCSNWSIEKSKKNITARNMEIRWEI